MDGGLQMKLDNAGLLKPEGEMDSLDTLSEVCPFAASKDEDAIGADLFGARGMPYDERIGYYRSVYVGHVEDDEVRSKGGSSGFVTWLLIELLERGLVHGVVHVRAAERGGSLFEYGVSRTKGEVLEAAKSKYHPAHFDEAIRTIRGDGNRYAFVGVPCFVKSLRLLCGEDNVLDSQIRFCIALFCGHMKSSSYSEFIASQVGVRPDELTSMEFRVKDPTAPANRYKFSVEAAKSGSTVRRSLPNRNLYGLDWGLGYFKPKACDWCDDIVGELADISSGDAWLPDYVGDPGGNNVVIVRSADLQEIVGNGRADGSLTFDEKTADDVYASQAGNYRHRREGLSVRVANAEREGVWHPRKRVEPGDYKVSDDRRELYNHRERLSSSSHIVFSGVRKNPLAFAVRMGAAEIKYYRLNKRLFRGSAKLAIQVGRLAVRLLRYRVFR